MCCSSLAWKLPEHGNWLICSYLEGFVDHPPVFSWALRYKVNLCTVTRLHVGRGTTSGRSDWLYYHMGQKNHQHSSIALSALSFSSSAITAWYLILWVRRIATTVPFPCLHWAWVHWPSLHEISCLAILTLHPVHKFLIFLSLSISLLSGVPDSPVSR